MDEERAYQTRVYRFRALADLPEEGLRELRRTHELSNQLVELEKDHSERIAEAWRQHPELSRLEAAIDDATKEIDVVVEELRKYKQKTRNTKPSPEIKAALIAARRRRKAAKDAFREKKNLIYPVLKPELNKLTDQLRTEIKATYRPAVDAGMYWANYNATRDRHLVAVKAVKAARRAGQPSDLRFRRWTGEGTLVVQLQRQAGHPPRTPATIADESGRWHNVAQLTPAHDPEMWGKLSRAQQRRIRLGRLKFRVGAGDEAGWVDLPVIVHRPIPPDADICMMEITRRRLGSRMLVHVSVVVRIPDVPARTEGNVVAMHIGWRALPDGEIRVAVLTGPATAVPEDIAGVVRRHGAWFEVVIPAWWRDQIDYVQSIASIRGKNLDGIKAWLLEWLVANPNHSIGGIETIDRWRSPARFAALTLRIRADDSLQIEVREQLEAWRRQDRHLWDLEANLRDKVIARRNDAFAKVAAWALEDAAVLSVDSFKITALARRPDITQEDSEAHRRARANRVLAAPGILRGKMVDGSHKRGVYVQTVDGTIAATHARCGNTLERAEREESVMVRCPDCDKMVDQDANTLELLRTYRAPVLGEGVPLEQRPVMPERATSFP